MAKTLRSLVLLATFAALASCAAERARVELRVAHALVAPAGPSDRPLVVDIEGRSVARLPAGLGRPLASGSTLVTGPSNEPLAASPSPGERVMLVEASLEWPGAGTSAEYGWVEALPDRRVLVPPGCMAALSVAPPSKAASDPPLVGLCIQAAPAGTRPLLTLRAERDASEEEEALGGQGPTGESRGRSWRVEWPMEQTEGSFVLAVPASAERGIGQPTLWRLTVREPGPGDQASEDARALLSSMQAGAAPHAPATPWPSLVRALRQPQEPEATRAALAFAAVGTAADLTAETAALAGDDLVRVLATGAADALEQSPADAGASLIGWSMDRATILTLARLHADGGLPRVMGSVLSARYGEVGRDPPALGEVARRCGSAAEMDRRLEAEHLILLDDASPALRVRAYDWLAARRSAPAGYDPLGPARERRAAVDQHLQGAEGKP